ncbi:MAG TPA: M23 family metallopeptidase [Microvirga sp.]|jgi:murein DD-endopeptidase MepM/ murein hydrolase activator NlpD|nr:M23 family metallopeptidase [Microvirga sp.]
MSRRPPDDESRTARGELPPASRGALGIDLGHEPPLSAGGGEAAEVDRRDINMRWLGACVLTGITGGALIGASIYIALEGTTILAQPPERAVATLPRPAPDDKAPAPARKGDMLNRSEMVASAKQVYRAPMTIRVGDREVMKSRQFVRIATNLSLSAGTYAADIPPFNPLRLFAEENGERYVEPQQPEVADADVSVVKRDLTLLTIDAGAPSLSDEDVLAILEEERRLSASSGRPSSVPIPAQQMLSRTLRQPGDLGGALSYAGTPEMRFSTIEVKVVPENVTPISRAEPRVSDPLVEERDLIIKKGETLEGALRALGANSDQINAILVALSARVRVTGLPEGQRARVLIAPGPRPGDGRQVVRVVLYGERGIEAIAAVNDRAQFVSVTPPNDLSPARPAAPAVEEGEEAEEGSGVPLYDSLYETALKNDLPRQTVDELVRVFGFDVDFQRRVAPGDSIELFFGSDEDNGPPEVLFAALNVGGEPRRVYRFQGDDGLVDYFDEQGRSLKKFLVRKPIANGILRSGFGYRRHPILGYTKMHTGTDWADRIGTPIFAAGNGTVIKAEWDSGYGRRIEIQHANGYVTAYSHQSRFAAGIAPGVRVRQGQVIGYVGNTGLSTGPHLHYEVLVNGHFVDPMKVRLPRGRELDGRQLADFKRQREQVDSLLDRTSRSGTFAQRSAELR